MPRAASAACAEGPEGTLWFSPRSPEPGEPVRILAVTTDAAADELVAIDDDGHERPLSSSARGGPPWSIEGELSGLRGTRRIEARRDGKAVACRETGMGGELARDVRGWDRRTGALFAAWVEKLFDAPPEESMSFPSLEPVLRNSERNFLYDYLGGSEDRRLPAEPDCADLPYFLRSYFAWKIGLPMAFRACSRGSAAAPPRCGGPTVDSAFTHGPSSLGTFQGVARRLIDTVHSGSARTGLTDNQTDLYPVALDHDSLWPGTVYADPYGHVLILVKWVPQTPTRPGMLLAADAQPDNSVTRKRFWEGTFLFADNIRSAGPGFKAFRPVAESSVGGAPRLLSNGELLDDARFPAYSTEQGQLSSDEFYARMGKLINPRGLDPEQAYRAALDALAEQVETRVESVDNGENYLRRNPRAVIPMPSGPSIFETIGPWEDYATPSRDMRLLIAMKVVAGLPERVVLFPDLFVLGGRSPDVVREELEQLHRRLINEREIHYTRSDGATQRLSLADIFARQAAFEVAYNPNDCVEARWGAEPGSEEYTACRRHAPPEQRARMQQYRVWFHETRRPPR